LYGFGDWRRINMEYHFNNRTTVDLKDKWRNMMKSERREQQRHIEDIARNGLHDSISDISSQ